MTPLLGRDFPSRHANSHPAMTSQGRGKQEGHPFPRLAPTEQGEKRLARGPHGSWVEVEDSIYSCSLVLSPALAVPWASVGAKPGW